MMVVLFLAVLMGSALMVYEATMYAQFRESLHELRDDGRNVLLISSSDKQRADIDAESCERLASISGVLRAGVMNDGKRFSTAQLGQNVLQMYSSSTLIPELRSSEVVVGRSLTDRSGSWSLVIGGNTYRATTGEALPAVLGLNSMVAFQRPSILTTVRTCVVELDERTRVVGWGDALSATLSAQGTGVIASPALRESQDPLALFLSRPDAALGLLCGIGGGVIQLLGSSFRATEFAAYLLTGTSKTEVAMMVLFEHLLCAGAFLTSAILAGLILTPVAPVVEMMGLRTVTGALAWVLASVGIVAIIARPATTLAKDR